MRTFASTTQHAEYTPARRFPSNHGLEVSVRDNPAPVSLFPKPMLQRMASCACGGVCPRCQSHPPLQAKLKIGQPNDIYEQEADRVAEHVMNMPEPVAQRKPG